MYALTDSPILSARKIAVELGISEGAIRKAVLAGRITGDMTLENVRYCLSSSVTRRAKVAIEPNKDYKPQPKVVAEKSQPRVIHKVESQPFSTTNNLQDLTLTEIKAVREAILAKKDELELFKLEGSLLDAEGVRKAEQIAGRMVREALETIPAKYASQCAAENDPLKSRHLLEKAIKAALTSVAKQLGGE